MTAVVNPRSPAAPDDSFRPPLLLGLSVLATVLGGLLAWSLLAHVDGAVIATGRIRVESNRKTVKHLEGGVVEALHVREGAYVEQGELLVRLEDEVERANLALIDSQLDELQARRARLRAEQDGAANFPFPKALSERAVLPQASEAVAGQRKLFEARRQTRRAEESLRTQRVKQLENQIQGLHAQQSSDERQIELLGVELDSLRELYAKGYESINRIRVLDREVERLGGERGARVAEIARARAAIGEAELDRVRSDENFRERVIGELREVEARIVDLAEERSAAADRLRRRDILAPQSGYVLDLRAHTVGGVIEAGEPILDIVPRDDKLIVAAEVKPQDIDKVAPGSEAVIRLSAFNRRTTPQLRGSVNVVSGDRLVDGGSGVPFYLALIELPSDATEQIGGLSLVPGMPVEVFIRTGERPAISYLLKPLTDSMARVFRED